jgi:hypothetical protein
MVLRKRVYGGLERRFFVDGVDRTIGLAQGRAVAIWGRSATIGAEGLNLPGVEINEVAFLPFATAEVEENLHFVAGFEAGKLSDLFLNGLELDVLRIAISLGRDDKFTFGEAAAEGLFVEKFL